MFETLVTTFSTSKAGEDLLSTQSNIRGRICERLGITDDELTIRLSNSAIKMDVTIFTTNNRVSVNNHLWQSFIEGKVYSTGLIHPYSIKLENAGTGTIMIDVK